MTISKSAKAFEIQHGILKTTGAWPEENQTVYYRMKGLISLSATCILGLTMLMEAYNDLNSFAALSEVLYILITVMVYNIKNINFIIQRKAFVRMVKLLEHPSLVSYAEDLDHLMVERIKSSRLLTQCYMFLVWTCVFLTSVAPAIEKRPLPYSFPYDLGHFTPAMYIFQVVSIFMVATNHLCYDSMAASLMGIAITHLEILARRIIRLNEFSDINNNNGDTKISAEAVKICIKYHITIIEYIECVDQVFSICIFSQFLASAVIICNSVFYFFLTSVGSSQFFMLINYIGVIFSELFMYCWFGNEIIWKSINIAEACYSSNWYNNGNKNINQYLFIIMERSKRPLKITASKISVLSLTAFTTIIRWSYSYFTLLMNLYAKQGQEI